MGQQRLNPVLRFAGEIGARLESSTDLPLLVQAYELGSASSPSFDERVAVLRLVERLSPDATMGAQRKARLIDSLNSQLHTAEVKEVLLLRNLSTTGLAANTLWASLESWAAANRFAEVDNAALLSAIDDATSTSAAVEPWRSAIIRGFVAD